ncbi:OsmC family protein [Mucilaginibacter lutimaris]|uniref:OsmC family protein n=1 Tax=Mucilaginibacter lutimaris TaxID=931629 RepID=A0ABW2ZEE3_9SPHI
MKYVLEDSVRGTIGAEKFRSAIRWRNGILITDEPEKLGGQDLGPDPFTLLLSSLVSCTLATLRMYIDHKDLNIKVITVEANMFHKLESSGPVLLIERSISLENVPDPEMQQRHIRIAESCPISKLLKGDIKITTEMNSEPAATGEDQT